MTSARATWWAIESEFPHRPGIVRRRVHREAAPDIYVGIDGASRARLFQLELSEQLAPDRASFVETAGFTMDLTSGGAPQRVCVTVRAGSAGLSEVFSTLAEDVLTVTSLAPTEERALSAFFDRLRVWQFMFARGNGHALQPHQVRGLIGELLFLERLWSFLGESAAVASWLGPFQRDRDFEGAGWAAEVKTTTLKPPYRVTISNIRQLDPGDQIRMTLAVFVIEESATPSAVGLPALVERVRGHLAQTPGADSARVELDGRLIAAGYVDAHADSYAERYTQRNLMLFDVRGGFPRLQEETLPDGVGDVRYSLALDACRDYRLDESVLQTRCG